MAGQKGQDSQKQNHSLQDFGGVNTQAVRRSIKDTEFAWLENVQPIGFGNMVSLPAPSAALAAVGSGTCYYMLGANLGNVDMIFMFCSDGSAYQVNLVTYVRTTVAPAGTFSASGTRATQWKNALLLIIDPSHGYYSWDGTTLLKINNTVASLTVTTPGVYTSRPTVIFGGPGSGANATAIVGLVAATMVAAGTGYFVNDVLTITPGGTNTTPAQLIVTGTGTSGAITGFSIKTSGDYTATPAGTPLGVTGGNGSAATFTPVWGVAYITLVSGGAGYTSAPAVTFSSGAAAATAYISVAPSGGACIASFSGRVWVSSGRTVVFSAPGSYTDFSTTNSGGSFVITDETLHSNINQLVVANNFLYILGDLSINVVSDVRVNTGITSFSNTNISASVGSTFPDAIIPYYRSIWFSTVFGIYALYGSTSQKASDPLDGVFTKLDPTFNTSGGAFVLNGILCVAFLVSYIDPLQGITRPLLMIYENKKWFFASQGANLKFVVGAEQSDTFLLFGTDGTSLFKLFSDQTTAVAQIIQTKLWDMGDPIRDKQVLKLGIESVYSQSVVSMNVTIDTENVATAYTISTTNQTFWKNNSGVIVSWQNNLLQTVQWSSIGYVFSKNDVSSFGKYVGVTISGTSVFAIYSGIHLQYELRASW